jgi:bifunctional N-acetylglucosamine-1-phosphate-uridyltransferase/glucosamine-1-phosphate-acetyltransferase GlmU-like protein
METRQLVVLAAGLGRRFGGVKQLAPVRADGGVLLDVALARGAAAGFDGAVVVVRAEIEAAVADHFSRFEPPVPVALVVQPPLAEGAAPAGTAHAVFECEARLAGASFAVVNADDLYPERAYALLAEHLSSQADEHAVVAFPLAGTLVGDRPVSRAPIVAGTDGRVRALREGTIVVDGDGDGFGFVAGGHTSAIAPDAWVSMNMWGFRPSISTALRRAVDAYARGDCDGEVLLPDVVANVIAEGGAVRALRCDEACIGITHPEDVAAVTAALAP